MNLPRAKLQIDEDHPHLFGVFIDDKLVAYVESDEILRVALDCPVSDVPSGMKLMSDFFNPL